MRFGALLLLAVFTGSLAVAADPDSAHSEIRRQLLSEFKYVAAPKEAVISAPFLADSAPRPPSMAAESQGRNVVRMAPYTVRQTVKMDELHSAILREQADARTAAMMATLGVGLHVVPVGKAYLYAATLFYIPFAVGAGFSF
jgi:hypothetical protein